MQDVITKLKFKDRGVILNAPPAIEKAFVKRDFTTSFDKKHQYPGVHQQQQRVLEFSQKRPEEH